MYSVSPDVFYFVHTRIVHKNWHFTCAHIKSLVVKTLDCQRQLNDKNSSTRLRTNGLLFVTNYIINMYKLCVHYILNVHALGGLRTNSRTKKFFDYVASNETQSDVFDVLQSVYTDLTFRFSQIGYQSVRNILMLTMYYMLIHLIPDTGPFRDVMSRGDHSLYMSETSYIPKKNDSG